MPARIVIVHDDPAFTGLLADRLGGLADTAWFVDPINALVILQHARTVEFLICRLQFADRQPIGLSLARVLRKVRPDVRVIFTGEMEYRHHTRGLGEFIPEPVAPAYVAMIVEWLADERS
jgi:CheY-like chemotaxis protein